MFCIPQTPAWVAPLRRTEDPLGPLPIVESLPSGMPSSAAEDSGLNSQSCNGHAQAWGIARSLHAATWNVVRRHQLELNA